MGHNLSASRFEDSREKRIRVQITKRTRSAIGTAQLDLYTSYGKGARKERGTIANKSGAWKTKPSSGSIAIKIRHQGHVLLPLEYGESLRKLRGER
jgi:hypothetical protein